MAVHAPERTSLFPDWGKEATETQDEKPEFLTPDFESLDRMDYAEFSSAIRPFNQRILEELRNSISRIGPPESGVAYFTPGSHAREENFLSPIELTLLYDDNFIVSDDYLDETKRLLDQDFPETMYPHHITIDARLNDEKKMPSIAMNGSSVNPLPSMLEAASLYDPSELLERTRNSIVNKLSLKPLRGKNLGRNTVT